MSASTGWMVVIILGSIAVLVGNLYYQQAKAEEERLYQKAKAEEDKQAAAVLANELLIPELKDNLRLAKNMLLMIQSERSTQQKFSTGAWEVASRGNLIRSLPIEELRLITQSYQHLLNASAHQDRLYDQMFGIGVTITGASERRASIMSNLSGELTKAVESINALLKIEGKSSETGAGG